MSHCIVIGQFPLPKRKEEQAISGGTSTAPIYRGLAKEGLIRTDYLNGDTGTGGVYQWKSRVAAEAWFTLERVETLTKKFGAAPTLTWYDTYLTVDNANNETRINGVTQPDLQAVE